MIQDNQIKINYKKILMTADKEQLSDGELRMFIAIASRINNAGYCDISNDLLCKKFDKSERTITAWISSLENKKIIKTIFNRHQHKRYIYIRITGLVKVPYQPITNPNLMSQSQFMFHQVLPDRKIDCEWDTSLDMEALIAEIKKSYFLRNNSMQLSHFKRRYHEIIDGKYRDSGYIGNPTTKISFHHNHSGEDLNSYFQDPDEIIV